MQGTMHFLYLRDHSNNNKLIAMILNALQNIRFRHLLQEELPKADPKRLIEALKVSGTLI